MEELAEGSASSYYAALNVPPDASQDEINKAYRKLAGVFHPDKHAGGALKEKARDAFTRLQEAYEVLSDPQRRQVGGAGCAGCAGCAPRATGATGGRGRARSAWTGLTQPSLPADLRRLRPRRPGRRP